MKQRTPRRIVWILLLIGLTACRESAAEAGRRGSIETRPDGVEHLRTPSVGMWGDEDGWSIVEEVRLGSLDSEGPAMPCTG